MNSETDDVQANIQDRKRISKVWFLPALAVLVGLSLLFGQWHNRATEIQITFDTAEGLEVGKTKLKYRNVEIGEVTDIAFNDDLSKILVAVGIKQDMRELLAADSVFWVVRPRLDAGGVTGFGTLVSGAYLEIAPGTSAERSVSFAGLEDPPVTAPSVAGLHLTLVASGGKPLKVGNPVVHKGYKVGRIEKFNFDLASGDTIYQVFIDAPYDSLVTTTTHFWNVGGVSLETTPTGVTLDIASIETLVSGGVEFAIPDGLDLGDQVEPNYTFELYSSKAQVVEGKKYRSVEYVVMVEEAIGGLNKGAPVEFRGIRVGTVKSAEMDFDDFIVGSTGKQSSRIPVVIKLEPDRVSQRSKTTMAEFKEQIDAWILSGLTARIEPANLLTGTLKVNLDTSGKQLTSLESTATHTVIPWQSGSIASLTEKLDSIMSTIDSLPLEQTVSRVNKALSSADQALVSLQNTLKETDKTLNTLQPNAGLFDSVQDAVDEFDSTLQSVKPLLQELSNQPNSLIFSGKKPADKEPKLAPKTN